MAKPRAASAAPTDEPVPVDPGPPFDPKATIERGWSIYDAVFGHLWKNHECLPEPLTDETLSWSDHREPSAQMIAFLDAWRAESRSNEAIFAALDPVSLSKPIRKRVDEAFNIFEELPSD